MFIVIDIEWDRKWTNVILYQQIETKNNWIKLNFYQITYKTNITSFIHYKKIANVNAFTIVYNCYLTLSVSYPLFIYMAASN